MFKQIYTQKLLTAFKMAYSCCFSLGGNLDFPELLQKKFYNINYRYDMVKHYSRIQRTPSIGGRITVLLVSSLTRLELTTK